MNLKNKLWGCFLIFLLFSCAIFFNYAYDDAKKTAIKDLNEKQISFAGQASIGIEDFFNQWTNLLISITKVPSVVNLDETGKKYISFTYEINKGYITAISRVDAKGKIIYTAPFNPKFIGLDVSGQKHIQEVIRSHKPVVSDVFKSVQGFDMVALHVPVIKNGEYLGTLGIGINFQNLAKRYLKSIRIGKTGYAWMIGRDGIEIYSPVPGHTGNSVFENYKEYPTIIAMAEKMIKENQGITTYTFDQIHEQKVALVKYHAVYMPIHTGQTFWSIVVASSENEMLSSIKRFRNTLILIIGLFFAGGAIFSFFGLRGWFIINEEQKRKKAEEALRRSEENFRVSLSESPMGVCIVTEEGETIYANRAILDIYGYDSLEELNSIPIERRFPPESHAEFQIRREKRKHCDDVPPKYELSIIRKNGEIRQLQVLRKEIFWDGEKQFQVTYQDITERKQTEDKIRASLREKDILISEIHHRVKNNLQVMSGLLKLQARASKNPEVIKSFNESQNRIRSIALVHEKLYNSKDFSKIDLAGYMRSLSQELFISHNIHPEKIDLTIEIKGDIVLDVSKAIPCGLVMNELISNALKHAFPADEPSKLQIIVRETESKKIEIIVRDNGVGLPDDVDIDEPKSVGLHLVNGLVKNQICGQMEVKRENGTEFRITFHL